VVGAGEGASAEGERADGAGGCRVGDFDEADRRAAIDGHGGNERDSDARTDQTEQAGKLSAFEDDLRRDASAVAGGDGVFTEAVAIAEEEKGILAKIAKGDGGAAGEAMFLGEGGEKRFGEQRKRFEFMAANGQSENGDIDGAGAET
jgi:hypothetical protein